MLSFHVKFVQTDRQTDRRTTVKQYAPDLLILGIKIFGMRLAKLRIEHATSPSLTLREQNKKTYHIEIIYDQDNLYSFCCLPCFNKFGQCRSGHIFCAADLDLQWLQRQLQE